ncbi:GrpB family protein [Reinekea sp. G2M2-21]|uniref:GrpB family protein n=1 Tax=Reinekea sp. G2M2-21 TaxID=2788942 RepID=UPI0018AC5543|nr:GrpB family protein [Reinekea sp. G2M2-21]
MPRVIEVIPYQPEWVEQFEREKDRIMSVLSDIAIAVHHIGSTSVPGLAAKPIIDILLECESLAALDERSPKLADIGYEAKGEFGIPRRRYFQKGGDQRSHHMHAFVFDDTEVHRHLAFRDYLRVHPEVAQQYADIKQQAAEYANHDSQRYCDFKDSFVKQTEQQALRWKADQHA